MTQIRTIPGVSNAVTDFSDGLRSEGRDVVTDAHIVPIRGAEGDGTTNDTTAINTWIAADKIKILPYGDYLAPGSVTSFSHPTIILADNAKKAGTEIPLITLGNLHWGQLPKTYMFVRQDTADRNDTYTVRFEKIVNTDDALTNPHVVRAYAQINVDTTQAVWAISGVVDNHSDTSGGGCAANSGVANKYGLATVFGGHSQANDHNIFATDTAVTPVVGHEINIQAIGLDNPTANGGLGNRIVLDLLARTNETVANWNTAGGNDGDAEIGTILRVRTDNETDASARYGIAVTDSLYVGKIATGILINTAGGRSLHLTGNVTGSHIQIAGNAANGLVLSGTYSGAAFRMNASDTFGLENTNTIKFTYGTVANTLGFYSNASKPTDATGERIGFNMTASPHIRVAGTQVVGARDTGWTAMTGTANENTAYDTATVTLAQLAGRVMALQTALTTHGLIGA